MTQAHLPLPMQLRAVPVVDTLTAQGMISKESQSLSRQINLLKVPTLGLSVELPSAEPAIQYSRPENIAIAMVTPQSQATKV